MSVAAEPVRLNYDDYVLYTEMHPDGDFELLDGVIYAVSPELDRHTLTRNGINQQLNQTLNLAKYTAWTETSFRAPGWAEGPKPDNFVSRGPMFIDGEYTKRPEAGDIALVIEISASIPRDYKALERKLKTYARVAIPEYWLIDLIVGSVVVHRDSNGEAEYPQYRSVQTLRGNETISAIAVEQLSISTDFLLKLTKTE